MNVRLAGLPLTVIAVWCLPAPAVAEPPATVTVTNVVADADDGATPGRSP